MTQFPCKDCKDRHKFCHDTCKTYKEAKRERIKSNIYLARRYSLSMQNYFNRRDKITKGNSEYKNIINKGV